MHKGILTVLALAAVMPAASAQERRALGPHQHGHGTLNLAIDGDKVLMELRVPGTDVVGFEHPAETAGDRAAVDRARTVLGHPAALVALSPSARCRADAAQVTLAGDGGHSHATHMEFHADYTFICAQAAAIDRLDATGYFREFPRARELGVNAITGRGQATYEAERTSPVIDLTRVP